MFSNLNSRLQEYFIISPRQYSYILNPFMDKIRITNTENNYLIGLKCHSLDLQCSFATKDAGRMIISVDPDQTAPLGAV